MWSVGGRVLVLAQHGGSIDGGRPSWSFARSTSAGDWELVAAPPAIDELHGGTVIDDELWFLARVSGVGSASTRWELVSTTNGQDWSSNGQAQLSGLDGVVFLGRVADRWVAATVRYYSGEGAGEGAIRVDLHWSDDGEIWEPAALPDMDGSMFFYQAAMLGDKMVVFGANNLPDGERLFMMHSTDGIEWLESPQPVSRSQWPTAFACGPTACVVLAMPTDSIIGAPTAFSTGNLQDWVESEIVAPVSETGGFLTNLSVTEAGFVAMGSATGHAFLSADGITWTSIHIIAAPGDMSPFESLVVSGSNAFALARDPDNGSPWVWSGVLPTIDD